RSCAVARSVQVLLLRLVRLLAGGGGRGCRRRGRGAALGRRPAAGAHRVAMGHVRGDGRRGDVDGVLTAVTGPVADVHLLLTVPLGARLAAGGRGPRQRRDRRSRRRAPGGGCPVSVLRLEIAVALLVFPLIVSRLAPVSA